MAYQNMGGQYDPSQLSYPGGAPGGYPGGYPGGAPPPQAGYPGPGGYPGGAPQPGQPYYPPPVPQDVQEWFDAVDQDRSGKISAVELQSALVNGQGKNFNLAVCQLMVGMFDKSGTGTIDVVGFQHLYRYVNQWLDTFQGLDKDGSGTIEHAEISQAFSQMGYRFSSEFIEAMARKADPVSHRISVDQFIHLCIQIQRFTDAFRSRDSEMKGQITIGFEDFLTVALSCS